MKFRPKRIGFALSTLINNEAKMAVSRICFRFGTHKIPFILKNGLGYEILYDLRFVPGYLWDRLTDNTNRDILHYICSTFNED